RDLTQIPQERHLAVAVECTGLAVDAEPDHAAASLIASPRLRIFLRAAVSGHGPLVRKYVGPPQRGQGGPAPERRGRALNFGNAERRLRPPERWRPGCNSH